MSTSPQYLRLKFGKRYWVLCVLRGVEPQTDFSIFNDDPNNPDLLLIVDVSEDIRQRWIDAVTSQHNEEWGVQFISNVQDLSLHESFSGPSLVVGPHRLVKRFCNSVFHRVEDHSEMLTTSQVPQVEDDIEHLDSRSGLHSCPELPDPADVPRFPAEGVFDPFGQNQQLRENAWSALATYVGHLARSTHMRELAVTLPPSPPGTAEPYLKPWQTVVPLATPFDSAQSVTLTEQKASLLAPDSNQLSSKLDLLQRCFVILTVLSHETPRALHWHDTAGVLEEFGYLLLSDNANIEQYSWKLQEYFEVGAFLAFIHATNLRYVDATPHNIGIDPELPLGERGRCIDIGAIFVPDHTITTLERAKDLTIMKMHCTLPRWEAVKLGYRFKAPKEAEEVFQLI